jgi:hypothetical protein
MDIIGEKAAVAPARARAVTVRSIAYFSFVTRLCLLYVSDSEAQIVHYYTTTMLRSTAVLALAGSAAAFAPMMSMDIDRRAVIQTGVAGAVAVVNCLSPLEGTC